MHRSPPQVLSSSESDSSKGGLYIPPMSLMLSRLRIRSTCGLLPTPPPRVPQPSLRCKHSLAPASSTSTRLDASTASLLEKMDMDLGTSYEALGEEEDGGRTEKRGGGRARERRRLARLKRMEEIDTGRVDAELVRSDDHEGRSTSLQERRHDRQATSTLDRDILDLLPLLHPQLPTPTSTPAPSAPTSSIETHSRHQRKSEPEPDAEPDAEARGARRSPASVFGSKRVGMMVLPEGMKRAIREEVAEQPNLSGLRNLYLSSLPHLTSTRRDPSSKPSSSKSTNSSSSQSRQTRDKDPVTPLSALLRAVVDLPGEYSAVRNVFEELRVRLGEDEFERLGLGSRVLAGEADRVVERGVHGNLGGLVIWDGGMGSGLWSLLGLPMEDDGSGSTELEEIEGDAMHELAQEDPVRAESIKGSSSQVESVPSADIGTMESPGPPVEYVHASRHMLDLSSRLVSTSTADQTRPIAYNRRYKSFAATRTDAPPSVAISTFHLSKLPTHRARANRIREMLDTGAELLIFVEEGTTAGYKAVLEARRQVLHSESGSSGRPSRITGNTKERQRAYVAEDGEDGAEIDEEDDVIEIAGEKYYPVKAKPRKRGTLDPGPTEVEGAVEELGFHVVAPCPHDKPCPLAASGSSDICSFSQRVQAPDFLRRTKHSSRGETDFRYTYVVLRRGKRPEATLQVPLGLDRGIKQGREGTVAFEEKQRLRQRLVAEERGEIVEVMNAEEKSFELLRPVLTTEKDDTESPAPVDMVELRKEAYGWPRLIVPPIKRSGHVILDSCHSSGAIVRLTVPRSQSKQAFYDARKSAWGDIFPHDTKGAEVVRTRGVKRLTKVEAEIWEDADEHVEPLDTHDWPVASLVEVDHGVGEDEIIRTFG